MTTAFPVSGVAASPEILSPHQHDSPAEVLAVDPLARAFSLPLTLTVEIPLASFTVGTLMRLSVGSVLETSTQQNEDLSLHANGQLIGPVEIEVLGDKLAVRLTGIA